MGQIDAIPIEKWAWFEAIEVPRSAKSCRYLKVRTVIAIELVHWIESVELKNYVSCDEKSLLIEQFVNENNGGIYLPEYPPKKSEP